jgi:transposase-like protein
MAQKKKNTWTRHVNAKKQELARRALYGGEKIVDIAKATGVNKHMISKWAGQLRKNPNVFDGPAPPSSAAPPTSTDTMVSTGRQPSSLLPLPVNVNGYAAPSPAPESARDTARARREQANHSELRAQLDRALKERDAFRTSLESYIRERA